MSKFFGVFYSDRNPCHDSSSSHRRAEDMGAWLRKQGPESHAEVPVVADTDHLAAVAEHHAAADGVDVFVDGHLRFDRDATHAFTDPARMARELLEAYRRHGTGVFGTCFGGYAVVIVDRNAGRVVLGVDRIGVRSLNYAVDRDGSLVFSTSLLAVAQSPTVGAALSNQAIFDFIHLHMVPSPATIFCGVHKLPRAHLAVFENGSVRLEHYWRPKFVETTTVPEEQLHEELHAQLQAAVSRCEPDEKTGAFLSGGLDSSTVAGKLAAVDGIPANTFSVGFAAEGYDELQYARLAAERFGTQQHEISLTADHIVEAIPKIAAFYDEPFGNSSAVPTYFCAQLARSSGMTRLLAGDGGDELFAGNPHYTRQNLFEYYRFLPGPIRHAVCEGLLARVIPEEAPFPFGKIRSYIEQAKIPLPQRLYSWNYLFRHPPLEIFSADFMATVDSQHPSTTMASVYAESQGASVIDRLLYFDWKYVLGDNDLRKVGEMCELGGVEVSYPMLDDALVDFSLRVPVSLKIQGQELRHFYKKAMAGFLPDEIIHKPKQGFGLPFGVWLKSSKRLQEYVSSAFTSLHARAIFNPRFLDNLLHEHHSGEPGYYGSVIWDVLMLEAWLQAHDVSV